MTRLGDLLSLVEKIAPRRLAEEWDNCGLMIGDKRQTIQKLALALDPTIQNIEKSSEIGAQVLLTHHPLIFRPLKNLDYSNPAARAVALAAQLGLSVVSAHTNLDSAAQGVATALANLLELTGVSPLLPASPAESYKLTVFVPAGYENVIRDAAFKAGAGRIGSYDRCSFAARGVGTFRPSEYTQPFIGKIGETESASESRLEFLIADIAYQGVLDAIRAAHPYEEPEIDIYRLEPDGSPHGLGCIGYLEKSLPFNDLISFVNKKLQISVVRATTPPESPVKTVALLPGSGGAYAAQAMRRGAQVLITGDVGYHQARDAEDTGICIIDAGHFATEQPVLTLLKEQLKREFLLSGQPLDIEIINSEKDPWVYYLEE